MSKPKLLLADDSLTIQKVVNLTFADEGIDVITVGDGDTALREIAQAPPDIVLADVHMPGPSGYEICSLMRGIDETAKIPVMLLVGSFEQFDPAEADRVGANGYVTKPFQSIRQLVDQVKGLIAAEPQVSEEEVAGSEDAGESIPEEADTSDIDFLYHQSFAETVEMPPEMAAEMAAAAYASDRLDDEMIETSYTAEQHQEPVEFGVSSEQENTENRYRFEPEEPNVISLDDDDLPDSAASAPSAEPETSFEETPVTPAMHTAPTEEFSVRDPFASKAHEFDLDNDDILDLGPANPPPVSIPPPPAEPAPRTPEAAEQQATPQVVTLAPEQLEIIVQKVVEKLSEKL
ncbi:MAG TPA: response regulator [Pyrinomonadaceae bacterium]|nr:response regulator [Pyrinomonadaceae bacterium]